MLDTRNWISLIFKSAVVGAIILVVIIYRWNLKWALLGGYCLGQMLMAGVAHFFFLPIRKGLEYNNSRLVTKGYWIRRYLFSYVVLLVLLVVIFEKNLFLGIGSLIGLLICKFAVIWGSLKEILNKERNHG